MGFGARRLAPLGVSAALGTHLNGISIVTAAGRQAGKKSGKLCVDGCFS